MSDEGDDVRYIRLVCLYPALMKYTGPVTGKMYIFNGGGSEVDVDERDVDTMLSRMTNASCCTGIPGMHYFEIAR